MASFSPSSWFNNVSYKEVAGHDVYSLTDPNASSLKSCFTGGYSEANMMLMFETMPEMFFVVNAIAARVKNGVYKLVDKDNIEITDNALWNKMMTEGPNWLYKFKDFIWHAEVYRIVTGNVYGYAYTPSTITPKHKNIQCLWLLPSHYVTVDMAAVRPSIITTVKASDYIKGYQYFQGTGMNTESIKPEYVTHNIFVKMGDTSDILSGKGISPLKAGEYPLSNLVAVYAARNVIYVKRGPLGAIVSAKSDASGIVALTANQKDEVITDLTNRFGFGPGQSPFSVTNQPVKYEKFGSTIAELEPFKETEASAAALCGILNIPTSLMPKANDPKFSNLDIAERNLYENVIFAEANNICAFLTDMCRFAEVGAKVVVSFEHVTCLQSDALSSAQAFKNNVEAAEQLYQSGHVTSNEVRDVAGYEAVDGGDEFKPEDTATTTATTDKGKKAKTLFGKKFTKSVLKTFANVKK